MVCPSFYSTWSLAHEDKDELKGQLLEMGICEVLIPLTNSPSSEVQGNSAAALGNLSSKGMQLVPKVYMVLTQLPLRRWQDNDR